MGRGLIAFLLFFVNLHSTAHAGVLLKLNAGSIDPTKLTSSQDSIFSSPSKNDRSSTNPQTPVSESKDQLISTEYILQFSKPITEFDKAQLKKYFKVFNYLPDDAMVVRGSWKQIQKYQSHHNTLRAAIQYAPSFKVSDEIWHLNVFNQNEFVAVIITLFSASEVAPIIKQIQNLDPQAALEDFHGRRLIFTLPRKRIPSIAGLTGVEHIEAVPQMELFDFSASENPRTSLSSEYSQLTGYEDGTRLMKFNAAWAQGFRGKNQIVAMADTGVDSGNTQNIIPDLQGAILQGQAFGQQSTSWADPMGHGTHIAGLLVGRGTASGGLIQGGANEAQLIAGSMWSPRERNMTVPAKLAVLFDGAYQAGARVHSNSWGSSKDFGAYDDSAAQVDEWMFNNPDMLIVFAAGNGAGDFNKDGRIDNNSLATPGTAKNALTVGASKNFILQGGE
ncbi:MAG TPA: S8 family serine peptidase, partial [Bdellovibrio sp.]|nr:S8 family serine peptidase [Bdellovibrio sp.]